MQYIFLFFGHLRMPKIFVIFFRRKRLVSPPEGLLIYKTTLTNIYIIYRVCCSIIVSREIHAYE